MQDWSPKQISGWLKTNIPTTRACTCPTERLIAAYSFKRAERSKMELIQHLHSKRRIRRSRHSSVTDTRKARSSMRFPSGTACGSGRSCYSRAWEGDLFRGARTAMWPRRRSAIALLHAGESARQGHGHVVAALSQHVGRLPAALRRSLTWDRGLEWPSTKASPWRPICRFTSGSAESLATRLERKHQRPTAAIPAKERRPVHLHNQSWTRSLCAQYPATTNLGISDSSG